MINCTPKLGGQFELESGGQFTPKLVVNLHWNRMVNLTGFSTFVKSQDFEKANKILLEISPYSLNENNELIKCPRCGAEEIEMVTSIKDLKTLLAFVLSLLLVLIPIYSKYRYKCNKCKFEFD